MLRYRVAAMVCMFMLLGAAFHEGLGSAGARVLWAAFALGLSYVAATTLNDVADRDLDRVNHPGDAGRPLVFGTARARELYALHVIAALLALTSAAALGLAAVATVGVSLAIGQAYSVRPLRLSYRTWLAPSILGVAYVLVPYALDLVAGAQPDRRDAVFAGALYLWFIARINLKDFRDREGDALYGRPTLLLRFGRRTTCWVSVALSPQAGGCSSRRFRRWGFESSLRSFSLRSPGNCASWRARRAPATSRSRSGSARRWATGSSSPCSPGSWGKGPRPATVCSSRSFWRGPMEPASSWSLGAPNGLSSATKAEVARAGIEPATPRFSAVCSTN
jgi:4-hydroxybenzoate polyprenyltransferase